MVRIVFEQGWRAIATASRTYDRRAVLGDGSSEILCHFNIIPEHFFGTRDVWRKASLLAPEEVRARVLKEHLQLGLGNTSSVFRFLLLGCRFVLFPLAAKRRERWEGRRGLENHGAFVEIEGRATHRSRSGSQK